MCHVSIFLRSQIVKTKFARPGLAHPSNQRLDGGAGDAAALARATVVHCVAQHLAHGAGRAEVGRWRVPSRWPEVDGGKESE